MTESLCTPPSSPPVMAPVSLRTTSESLRSTPPNTAASEEEAVRRCGGRPEGRASGAVPSSASESKAGRIGITTAPDAAAVPEEEGSETYRRTAPPPLPGCLGEAAAAAALKAAGRYNADSPPPPPPPLMLLPPPPAGIPPPWGAPRPVAARSLTRRSQQLKPLHSCTSFTRS